MSSQRDDSVSVMPDDDRDLEAPDEMDTMLEAREPPPESLRPPAAEGPSQRRLLLFIALVPFALLLFSRMRRADVILPASPHSPVGGGGDAALDPKKQDPFQPAMNELTDDDVLKPFDTSSFEMWVKNAAAAEGSRLVCAPARRMYAKVTDSEVGRFSPTRGDSVGDAFAKVLFHKKSSVPLSNSDAAPAIAAMMAHTSWPLLADAGVRQQYRRLDGRRSKASEKQPAPLPTKTGSDDVSGLNSDASFSPLSALAANPEEASASLWEWPLTQLLPLPSFVTSGSDEDVLVASAADHHFPSWSDLAAKLVGSAADTLKQGGPIHSDIDAVRLGGSHRRDSILINSSAPVVAPLLARVIAFSLAPEAAARLQIWELNAIDDAFVDACDRLADAFSAKERETLASQAARDSCDSGLTESSSSQPPPVLVDFTLNVLRTDNAAFPSSLKGGAYERLPIPHGDMSEAYSLAMGYSASAAMKGKAFQGDIIADTLWGALRALTTAVSVVEEWNVDDDVSSDPWVADSITAATGAHAQTSKTSKCMSGAVVGARLPLFILDAPLLPWRGLLIDTARHFIPPATILQSLGAMALAKMNVLHWHVSDAQSFPLALPSRPNMALGGKWGEGAIYKPHDVVEIVTAAARRGIRVVPEFDMPAHAASWKAGAPNAVLDCSATVGGTLKALDKFALDPTVKDTYHAIEDVIRDASRLFPDAVFHVGADEVAPECWTREPRLKAFAKKELAPLHTAAKGTDDDKVYAALLAFFLSKVTRLVEQSGKQPLMWEDSFVKLHKASGGKARYLKLNDWTHGTVIDQVIENAPPTKSQSISPRRPSTSSTRTPTPTSTHLIIERDGGEEMDYEYGESEGLSRETDDESVGGSIVTASSTPPPSSAVSSSKRKSNSKSRTPTSTPTPTSSPSTFGEKDDDDTESFVEQSPSPTKLAQASRNISRSPLTSKVSRTPTPSRTSISIEDVEDENASYGDILEEDDFSVSVTPTPSVRMAVVKSSTPSRSARRSSSSASQTPSLAAVSPSPGTVTITAEEVLPSLLSLSPNVMIQGWKCWEGHADAAIASAAATGHATLNAACWYLDASTPWGDFARHWPFPEHPGEWAQHQARAGKSRFWPRGLFSTGSNVTLGGEAAMWTERVDASNFDCRVWPRAGATADVGWSQSLAYDRVARSFTAKGGASDARLFTAPRMLTFTRRLLRAGMSAATLSIFAPGDSKSLLAPSDSFESNSPPFNGMCPGIEQAIQRSRERADELSAVGRGAQPPPRIRFATWNVHDGASGARGASLLKWLRNIDADVVAIIEASGWDAGSFDGAVSREMAEAPFSTATGVGGGSLDSDFFIEENASQHDASSMKRSASAASAPMSAAFRRRAASAGFPHAHLAVSPSGFNVAILSAHPVTLVSVDVENFSRAALTVDSAGIRWIVVHLHAQDAGQRLVEASHIARRVEAYAQAGLPVVVLGDFNTLSPNDSVCHKNGHAAKRIVEGGGDAARGAALAAKFLCASTDPACAAQATQVGESTRLLDYRPFQALLSAGLQDLEKSTEGHCPTTYPTAAIAATAGVVVDGHDDNGGLPLRLDFALGNSVFHGLFRETSCIIGSRRLDFHANGTAGGWRELRALWQRQLANATDDETLRSMVFASDHLPVVCEASSKE